MLDPSQPRRRLIRSVLSVLPAILLLSLLLLALPAAGDVPPAVDAVLPGQDGVAPMAASNVEGVPDEAATPSPAGQEDQEPVPRDAVPAETLVTPEDTRVLEQAEIESPPPGRTAESPETFDVPIELNDKVRAYLDLFTGERRERIQEAFDRAGRYLPMMRSIFQEYGLPLDLVNLAYIESAFKVQAYSRARAVGIWQFIGGTGRKYGLRIDWWLDERRDPAKATRAAAEYLRDLYALFDSWTLAIAGYNAGEGKVAGAMRRQKTADFWRLRLPRETTLYVPAFMAMTILAKDPARYGFVPPVEEEPATELLALSEPLDLRIVAQASAVPLGELQALNPELNHLVTPPQTSGYRLRVPPGAAILFAENFSEIKKTRRVTWQRHMIRQGETLSQIARRYDTSVRVLLDLNRLASRHRLRAGRSLVVPLMHLTVAEDGRSNNPAGANGGPRTYVVKRGDNLWDIAQSFDVSPHDLQQWNDLDGSLIHPGLRLRLHPD